MQKEIKKNHKIILYLFTFVPHINETTTYMHNSNDGLYILNDITLFYKNVMSMMLHVLSKNSKSSDYT